MNNLSESQINAELLARHSRTSGSIYQKRERLQQFLEIEDQKKIRRDAVRDARETAANDEVSRDLNTAFRLEEVERAATILVELRNSPEGILRRLERLERIADSLDERITQLELADMPPLLPDSNPNWPTSPYAWECTELT